MESDIEMKSVSINLSFIGFDFDLRKNVNLFFVGGGQ